MQYSILIWGNQIEIWNIKFIAYCFKNVLTSIEIRLSVNKLSMYYFVKTLSRRAYIFFLLLESINMVSSIYICHNVKTTVSFPGLIQHVMTDFPFLYPEGLFVNFVYKTYVYVCVYLCLWKKLSSNPVIFLSLVTIMSFFP